MAQYDQPLTRDEFESNIGDSNISEGTKQSIDQLFANQDTVNVKDYDPDVVQEGVDVFVVPAGTEVTGDPGGSLVIFGGGASGTFEAGEEPRAIIAQSDDSQNLIFTGNGQVTVETGSGNDIVSVDPGVEATVSTGDGFDGVVITKSNENVTFEIDADGNLQVTGSSYTIDGAEFIQFDNAMSVVAADEDQAIVARMYQVLFDREPDTEGLEYWFDVLADAAIEGGQYDMWDVTHAFMSSNEFEEKYSDMDDEEFLTQLYLGMDDRTPDAEGFAYWLDVIADPEEYIDSWKGEDDNAWVHVAYAFAYSDEAEDAMGEDGSKYIISLYDDDDVA